MVPESCMSESASETELESFSVLDEEQEKNMKTVKTINKLKKFCITEPPRSNCLKATMNAIAFFICVNWNNEEFSFGKLGFDCFKTAFLPLFS